MPTLEDVIRGRRSIRRYAPEDVTDAVLLEVLDMARHAPSSMDGQPWRFVVVRERATRARIAAIKNLHCPAEKRAYSADFLLEAPVIVLVGVERERSYGRGRESAILATGTLLLAAHAKGLAGVYLSASDDGTLAAELAALLELPGSIEPVTLVALGHPAETPAPRRLRPLSEMLLNA